MISDWQAAIEAHGPWAAAAGYTLLTVALFIVWQAVQRKILQKAQDTRNLWDDVLVQAVGTPLTVLIIVLGGLQVVSALAVYLTGFQSLADSLQTIRSFVIFIAFFWLILRIINGVELRYRRRKLTIGQKQLMPGALHTAFQIIRAVIFLIAALTALEVAGVSISGLLAFGGIGGVIIGFAAKDTLANFFSGLLIFWERPFVVGDWIRRPDANIEGVVEDIGWRMTQIRTFDQRPLYVPNSLFFNSVIENPQRMTHRRIYEYIGVRYDDIDKLPALLKDLRAMVDSHAGIAQDQIKMIHFDRYGASSLDFFIYVMTSTTNWQHYHEIKEDILLAIAKIVAAHGCEFAFPTRTLHHINPPAPLNLPPQ